MLRQIADGRMQQTSCTVAILSVTRRCGIVPEHPGRSLTMTKSFTWFDCDRGAKSGSCLVSEAAHPDTA